MMAKEEKPDVEDPEDEEIIPSRKRKKEPSSYDDDEFYDFKDEFGISEDDDEDYD